VGATLVLQELRDEGTEITLEVLACLALFRTAHINRFGVELNFWCVNLVCISFTNKKNRREPTAALMFGGPSQT